MKISKMGVVERLIASYKSFIEATVNECKNSCSLEPEELFEEGVVGLLKAVDESVTWKDFASRVERRIRGEIELAIRVELHFAKLSQNIREDFAEYRRIRAMLFYKLRRPPTIDEIAAKTTLPRKKLERLEILYRTALGYEED